MKARTTTKTIGWTTLLAAFLAPAAAPAVARAQAQPWSVDGRIGVGIPAGDLSDVADPGVTFGLGGTYWFHPRVGIKLNGDLDLLTGLDAADTSSGLETPDLNLWRYNAGVVLQVVPRESRWTLPVYLGAGAATYTSDDFPAGVTTADGETDLSTTSFSTVGSLQVGYDVTEQVNVYVGGKAYLDFVDEEDTAVFNQITNEVDPQGFDTAWTIPLTAGVKIRF